MTYYEFIITGTVQGVGFRPFIYNACTEMGLSGTVQNIGTGVKIIINDKNAFQSILETPPPNARIDHVTITEVIHNITGFSILQSEGVGFSEIPADLNLCDTCRRELFDVNDRRYHYFFMTCTQCGPRFSMAKNSPYDRPTTTMSTFPMCDDCTQEYENPKNRRYHAQTIACHACGPELFLYHDNQKIECTALQAIEKTAHLLQNDELIAIKGVGGFHVVCNTKPKTIKKLKKLTGRHDKPFALMCRDIPSIKKIANISPLEKELLQSQERPIVVLTKKNVCTDISELNSVGIMLPYTALHELLFSFYNAPLVMTSANSAGYPITTMREEQHTAYVLDHTRAISNSVDDSLIKVIADTPLLIRRSRGYVPQSIGIKSKNQQTILALGAEMNGAFALYKDGRITMSQYIGNTGHPDTFDHYKKTLSAL